MEGVLRVQSTDSGSWKSLGYDIYDLLNDCDKVEEKGTDIQMCGLQIDKDTISLLNYDVTSSLRNDGVLADIAEER
jgi:hypothetical protein